MASRRASRTTLATLWLSAALIFFVCEAIAARSLPSPYVYSYVSNYISVLGVAAWTPLAAVMNVGLSVQGILFLLGAILAARMTPTGPRRLFIALASLHALGIVLVASVPSGTGVPENNLRLLHGLGALLAIVGGNAAIVAGAAVVTGFVAFKWYRTASAFVAVLGLSSFLILGQSVARPYLGLFERGSLYSIMLWQMFSAILLLARRREAVGLE